MSCTRPKPAQQYYNAKTGTTSVRLSGPGFTPNIEIPCGKCLSCKLRKAREWALRCWHESQMHEDSAYVTFTYRDQDLPSYENLDHRDFQLFMKRLRFETGLNVRYYMCGEYGDETHRPHYHALLFGFWPPDAKYHRTDRGNRYYKSEMLDKLWSKGFTDTSYVTYKSAGYIARYTLKKQLPREEAQDRYTYVDVHGELRSRKFEYIRMSLNPAIGLAWIKKYWEQTLHHDYVLDPDGNKCPVPGYYLDVLAKDHPEQCAENQRKRIEIAQDNPDNSASRRSAKETCTEARSKQLIRPYL